MHALASAAKVNTMSMALPIAEIIRRVPFADPLFTFVGHGLQLYAVAARVAQA